MRLYVSPEALQDLREIKEYISLTLCNPTAANRVIRKIVSTYKRLTDQPYIGTLISGRIDFVIPYRYLVSGNYLIIYQVHSDIHIIRIIYGKRDYHKILGIDPDISGNTDDSENLLFSK